MEKQLIEMLNDIRAELKRQNALQTEQNRILVLLAYATAQGNDGEAADGIAKFAKKQMDFKIEKYLDD